MGFMTFCANTSSLLFAYVRPSLLPIPLAGLFSSLS